MIFINAEHFIYIYFFSSQLVSNEKNHQDESQQEQSIIIRKQVPSVDNRLNRKSMFEQSTTQANTHAIERVNFFILIFL